MPARPKAGRCPIVPVETLDDLVARVIEIAAQLDKPIPMVTGKDMRDPGGVTDRNINDLGGIKQARARALMTVGVVEEPEPEPDDSAISKIVRACRKGPVTQTKLADLLDVAPRRVARYLEECRQRGIDVYIEGDHVATKRPQRAELIDTEILPTVGEPFRAAVVSDLHLGSKYCMRAQIVDFVTNAVDEGCRVVLIPGDVLEGNYNHAAFERTHNGIEDQKRDLLEVWPDIGQIPVVFITGNHDETFWKTSGVNVGGSIERTMNDAGHNWHHVGDRGAFVDVGGAVVHLHHPKQGSSYAKSYGLQKKVEGYTSLKPQILISGHWHQFSYVDDRAVHSMAAGCFQGSQSAYAKSLRGSVAMGGTILQWSTTEHGTVRRFSLERHSYYEKEEARRINVMPGDEVAPALSRATWEPGE